MLLRHKKLKIKKKSNIKVCIHEERVRGRWAEREREHKSIFNILDGETI